jgi:hypothetical protein
MSKQETKHKVNHRGLRDVFGKASNRFIAGEVFIQWKRAMEKQLIENHPHGRKARCPE